MPEFKSAVCPSCDNEIKRHDMDRLTAIVWGFRTVRCSQCHALLQWSKNSKKKLKPFAYLAYAGFVVVILGLAMHYQWVPFLHRWGMIVLALGVAAGIFSNGLVRYHSQKATLDIL